jgi:NAD/NADP transhydrogenase beta subunit
VNHDAILGHDAVNYIYLLSAALFILALKWMGQVKTARRGNWAGTAAMALAVIGTLLSVRCWSRSRAASSCDSVARCTSSAAPCSGVCSAWG